MWRMATGLDNAVLESTRKVYLQIPVDITKATALDLDISNVIVNLFNYILWFTLSPLKISENKIFYLEKF